MEGWLTADRVFPYLILAGRIIAILALAAVASRIASASLKRMRGRFLLTMMRHTAVQTAAPELEKRVATINEILRRTVATLIWVGAILMALNEAKFNIGPLLAGASIAGLAVGFGAQNLVRDVISGIFILLENQIRIDDVVIINGTLGKVEEINLRTTVLRSHDGTIHVFRNGGINTLSNMTWQYSYAVVAVRTGHKEDPDRVAEALRGIGDEIRRDERFASDILEPLEVVGVEQLADFGFVTQVRCKTVPMQQFPIGRELNRRIEKRFRELGIELK